MTRLILGALFFMLAAVPAAAQTMPEYRLGETRWLEWDCPLSGPNACHPAHVARFDVRLDTTVINAGKTASPGQAETFRLQVPPLAVGVHTAAVRACNVDDECSEYSATLTFRVRSPIPGRPSAPRMGASASAALTIPRAATLANCVAEWVIDRPFTSQELVTLASQHPPVAPTKDTVEAVLNANLPRLLAR